MTVAKEFVRTLRSELAGGADTEPTRLSLRVYGASSHRLRRDCTDTERIVGPGASPDRWSEAIAGVHPLGVSPLAYTLERAAADSAPVTVLVADGVGNCGGDACGVWRRVTAPRGNRRARLHVVAIEPEPEEMEALRCLSREGSGAFLRISEPGDAVPAARRLALVLTNRGVVDVRLSLGGAGRHAAPVRLLRPLTGEVTAAFTSRAPTRVPAGMYTMVIETAPPDTVRRVMVLPGDTVRVERADLGRLAVVLRPDPDLPVRAPVSVYDPESGTELRYFVASDTTVLRAGRYDVQLELPDSLAVRRGVEVRAGETALVAYGGGPPGRLEVVIPGFEEPPPTRALLYRAGRIDTMPVGRPAPIAPGRYRLVVNTIPPYVSDDVRVEPERTERVVLPETGVIRVVLVGPEGPISGIPIEVSEPLTGEVYGTIESGSRALTMPGTFRLEIATAPPEVVEGVRVGPGEERIVRRRGYAAIALAKPLDEDAPPVRLEVAPAADGGEAIAETSGTDPIVAALPGLYRVRVWRGAERLWEGRVTVAPGEIARIDWPGP